MAKIIHLDIKNYRGIRHLPLEFKIDQNLICLIGRGDSGKTTILDAISSALSPSWNLNFYDTDFYNCDHSENIEILVSLIYIPEKLLYSCSFFLDTQPAFSNFCINPRIPNLVTFTLSPTVC